MVQVYGTSHDVIRIRLSTEIERPVEVVFAYAVDRANLPRWFPGVVAAEPSGPLQAGMVTTIYTRMLGVPSTIRGVIEAYEPPSAFAVRVDGLLAGKEDERFVATSRGTRIEYTGNFTTVGCVRVFEPVLAWFAGRTLRRAYARLKLQLEATRAEAARV
jgi:uncharacterized protein YndB with AHSA1/START domain